MKITRDLCLLEKKRGVDQVLNVVLEKKLFFGWRQGRSGAEQRRSRSGVERSPTANQKKKFFSRTTFESLGQLLFFFQADKDPVFLFFEMGYSKWHLWLNLAHVPCTALAECPNNGISLCVGLHICVPNPENFFTECELEKWSLFR